MRSGLGSWLLAAALLFPTGAGAQLFLPDDPIRVDPDRLPIAKPAEVELVTAYDVIEHTFSHRPSGPIAPAANVNTLGEVPDSSWFENRIAVRALSLEELVRGPNTNDGPDTSAPWTVLGGKTQGITPGFTIRDRRGDVYFVKFDPPAYPNLSTAADVISTKFFHAMGYFVPENHLTFFRKEQLEIGSEARVAVRGGPRRRMVQADLDLIFAKVARLADGRIRAVASRRLPGQPLGPHKYHGLRGDDPNDLVPHENRRDLRGLRVFAAWLNHDDSRSINSLDMYRGAPGEGHVQHYLIDFSSSLGSGSDAQRRIAPQNPRAGNEYIIDWGPMLKSAATLGLWDRPWRKVRYVVHPEIGRLEADFFEPERWKPEYPNPAFERMQPQDAFWAARIVSRFDDAAVRALVHTGQFTDVAAEERLAELLIRRRDKIVARYFSAVNPLDEFSVNDDALRFRNLGEEAGLARATGYEQQWFELDNADGQRRALGPATTVNGPEVALPASGAEYLVLRLRTVGGLPQWRKYVDVVIRRGTPFAVVGLLREG